MNKKLNAAGLMTLEAYAREREDFRRRVMAHKKNRTVALGKHITLYFEDETTMRYQVQEMLRAERIFEPDAIQEELDAYNPLIPEGSDWRATMMIEYADPKVRRVKLAELVGVERTVWARVGDCEKTAAVANEDLERSTEEKTSAVHFLRFPLNLKSARAVCAGKPIRVGVAHRNCSEETTLSAPVRKSLVGDINC